MGRRERSWVAYLAVLAAAIAGLALWCARRPDPAGESAVGTASSTGVRGSNGYALEPARGAILGAVTAEAGGPIARAQVCAQRSDERAGGVEREPTCTATDAAGRYELAGLVPGRYTISASAPTFRPSSFARGTTLPGATRPDARTEVVLAAGARETGIDLVLRSGGVELTGVVLDLTGGPVSHARVRATSGRGALASTESGADGRFTAWVAPGGVHVRASAEGYADAAAYVDAPGAVELLLTPESSLAGKVVDAATGAPVEGARVTIESLEAFEDAGGSVRTDVDGTFRLARLTPGRYAVRALAARGTGHSDGSVLVGLGEHVDGIVVRLWPAHRLEGTIVIATSRERCTRGTLWLYDVQRGRRFEGQRADDGTMYADGLLPATYRVHASCEGYRSRASRTITIADADVIGEVWEVDPGATLRGRIRTRAGAPVEQAQLSVRSGGDERASDESDDEGRYELAGLPAGTYRLQVDSRHGIVRDADVVVPAAGTVERDLVLDDGASIAGVVVDPAGTPVTGVTVVAELSGAGWGDEVRTDARGAFQLPPQVPGSYRVVARRGSVPLPTPGVEAGAPPGTWITARAGAPTHVRLVVEAPDLAITGVVLDARGMPVPDAFVAVARESGERAVRATRWTWDQRPVVTGTDGRFTVAGLAAGDYTVRASRKGGGEAIAEHVAAGTAARLQIRPVGSIEGIATRPGGPIDELSIELVDRVTGLERREQFLGTDGRFAVRDLPAGAFTLTARATGAQTRVPIELSEGERKTGVSVELVPLVELTGRLVELRTRAPIPGIRMMVALEDATEFTFAAEPDRANITDAAGRFTLRRAPTGRVVIRAWAPPEYVLIQAIVAVRGSGTIEVGDIGLLARRVSPGQPVGELGVRWAGAPNAQTIAAVLPRSAAARAGLVAGDVVVAIDDIDVRGDHGIRIPALCHAPPGTTLAFTLARGATVAVTLAAP